VTEQIFKVHVSETRALESICVVYEDVIAVVVAAAVVVVVVAVVAAVAGVPSRPMRVSLCTSSFYFYKTQHFQITVYHQQT
jgi:hypothetical protein